MTHTVKVNYIPEQAVEGKPLGRHVWHDSRSLAYPYRSSEAALRTVLWARLIAILDQLRLGSCTGNGLTGALGTTPLFEALPAGHPTLNEALAVRLYGEATRLDGYPGSYPPDDTGSDGLSVCKAGVNDGLLSGYTHCFDLNTALQALSAGPVLFGINWYDSFDSPDSSGLVAISPNASVRGGHEIVARGLDTSSNLVYLDNSWGTSWGNNGSFSMSWDTLTRLLAEQGDATVPIPATLPAPVPVPVPPTPTPVPVPVPVPDVATPADVQLAHDLGQWPYKRHAGANKVAAADIVTWEHAKNLGPG
jgi:hypothetical protein